MLPYLIAGVIGYGISKLFDDKKAPKYADGGLIAPNGKPSNLTPEQYKLVRTPAFKKWFGDWENDPENASKIVDENGEPLVVYHGSNNKFNEFKNLNDRIVGYYFSSDLENSKTYGEHTINTFLNIKNPLIVESKGLYFTDDIPINILAKYPNELSYEAKIYLGIDDIVYMVKNGKRTNEFIEIPNRQKYDGVIFKNIIDPQLTSRREVPQDTIVAFQNNQIKLADGTNTTFDGNNPDIRFGEGGELESLSKESLEVIDNNYDHIFGFYDFEWNKEFKRENFNEWLNNFRKKQFKKNLDVAIKNIESDIELIKKRKIVDLKLKAFEELIIPTLGNQVLSPKLSQYETMVLMNPSATIESLEKGFQEAKNIIDEDGSLNKYKITPSNLFQDDSINLPNFERFVESNPEYTGVFNDWKKIFDEHIKLTLKDTYAFRYPSLEQLEKLHSELLYIKNNKTTDIRFKRGGNLK